MLRQIKYFQAVVRLNSFTQAAEECYISQSAISQQIQALEKELGVNLIIRENRKFSLTPAGEHFYRKSLILTSDFDKICRETVRLAKSNDAELCIGYLKGYVGSEIQLALSEFSDKYPNVKIEIMTGNHEELYLALKSEKVDLVLNDQRRAFSDEYYNFELATHECFVEFSARNPISAQKKIDVDELKGIPCILVASKNQQENEASYYRDIVGINGEFIFAEGLEEARLMVIGGKGFMPIEGRKTSPIFSNTLCHIPLYRKNKPVMRKYCAFWKADNSGYYVEIFADILKSKFTELS